MCYHNVGTSLELHSTTKDTINPAYHTITDDHSKRSLGEPISYYEEVNRPPEVKMHQTQPMLSLELHSHC